MKIVITGEQKNIETLIREQRVRVSRGLLKIEIPKKKEKEIEEISDSKKVKGKSDRKKVEM